VGQIKIAAFFCLPTEQGKRQEKMSGEKKAALRAAFEKPA